MKKILLLLVVAAGVFAVSCGNAEKDLKVAESTQWKMISLAGVENVLMPEEDSYTLAFSNADGRFFGKANCNRYFGTYSVDKEYKMTFSKPGATMMMCRDDNSEGAYLSILDKVSSFAINSGNLELVDANGAVLATFKALTIVEPTVEKEAEHDHSGECNH